MGTVGGSQISVLRDLRPVGFLQTLNDCFPFVSMEHVVRADLRIILQERVSNFRIELFDFRERRMPRLRRQRGQDPDRGTRMFFDSRARLPSALTFMRARSGSSEKPEKGNMSGRTTIGYGVYGSTVIPMTNETVTETVGSTARAQKGVDVNWTRLEAVVGLGAVLTSFIWFLGMPTGMAVGVGFGIVLLLDVGRSLIIESSKPERTQLGGQEAVSH